MLHLAALLIAMDPGAPAPGCSAGQDACFYEEPDGDPGQCILAVRTGAGWHHTPVANCTWMVIGSTPTPTATLQRLERRELLADAGRELVLRFRLAVYERGERESDDRQPGTRTFTDFVVVCATATGTPGCTEPLAIAGGTVRFDGRGRRIGSTSWRRSWRVTAAGELAAGRVRGRGCPLDPDGMYGARAGC